MRKHWTILLDVAAVAGLALVGWGLADLAGRPAAAIWAGGWITALAVWVARDLAATRK